MNYIQCWIISGVVLIASLNDEYSGIKWLGNEFIIEYQKSTGCNLTPSFQAKIVGQLELVLDQRTFSLYREASFIAMQPRIGMLPIICINVVCETKRWKRGGGTG